uniref:Uncharacterized protein n=1 Tax=Romanomermis culicivorax TaxID=13658 RepID=A0A915KHF3_ROMCU
ADLTTLNSYIINVDEKVTCRCDKLCESYLKLRQIKQGDHVYIALIPFPTLDLDERYFYYLAISREQTKALLCKRQSNDEYTNDICPFGNNTKTDEPSFKFYIKILEHKEHSVMLFNKQSQQAITIQFGLQQDKKLPTFEIAPETPTCHGGPKAAQSLANV